MLDNGATPAEEAPGSSLTIVSAFLGLFKIPSLAAEFVSALSLGWRRSWVYRRNDTWASRGVSGGWSWTQGCLYTCRQQKDNKNKKYMTTKAGNIGTSSPARRSFGSKTSKRRINYKRGWQYRRDFDTNCSLSNSPSYHTLTHDSHPKREMVTNCRGGHHGPPPTYRLELEVEDGAGLLKLGSIILWKGENGKKRKHI